MSSAGWFSLIKVILKHGHFAIPAYDYQKARQKELEKPDSYTPVGAIRKEAGFRHSNQFCLYHPRTFNGICQLLQNSEDFENFGYPVDL